MKATSSYRRALREILSKWKRSEFHLALSQVERALEHWPDNPPLLRLRGQLTQLQDESGPDLRAAKTDFERAADLDSESPAALTELAHYLFAVEDDTAAALRSFDKSIQLAKRLLIDALEGKAKTLAEKQRDDEAFLCMAEILWISSTNGQSVKDADQKQLLARLREIALD